MALVLLDGFEDLTSWPVGASLSGAGRNGNGLLVGTSGATVYLIPTALQTASATLGTAIKVVSSGASAQPNITLRSDNDTINHIQVVFQNGYIEVWGGGSLRNTTAGGLYTYGNWFYVEMQAVLHDTTGSIVVRVNGNTVASLTNIDTKNAGTKTVFDAVRINAGTVSGGTTHADDFYMTNSIDTFWGDIAVETLYPDGMDTTAWTGSDGDALGNQLLIDESGTPVDTDYVLSSTVAAREIYTLQNLVRTSGSVLGVQVNARANKSDSGARGLKVVAKESGGTIRSSSDNALTTTFTDYSLPLEKKNDNSAWTIADVNALGIGVEVGS